MDLLVLTYILYVLISVSLIAWVARTLFKHGSIFLLEVFRGNELLADSVNHLLAVGFYLVSLGYMNLMMKVETPVTALAHIFEALSWKIGLMLGMLGVAHFMNLFLSNQIRQQRHLFHSDRSRIPHDPQPFIAE